jgi:hypothetical protein
MGVGSEVYSAVGMGRRGMGVELKPSYYVQAKRNLESGVATNWTDTTGQTDLFEDTDIEELEESA